MRNHSLKEKQYGRSFQWPPLLLLNSQFKIGLTLILDGLAVSLILFGTSCSSVQQRLDPSVYYKRDMELRVNGFEGEGVLVVPKAESYKFEIKAKGRLDLFTLTTCHREEALEEAGQKGLFGDRKRVETVYKPVNGIENDGLCAVQLGGYEKVKGRHSWAFIDFENESNPLPARIFCNGNVHNANGVSSCQSREGLLQQIRFTENVDFSHSVECNPPTINGGKDGVERFEIKLSRGQCVYVFMRKSDKAVHRLTTYGYQDVLIRGD